MDSLRPLARLALTFLAAAQLALPLAQAQQPESAVPCNEGSEPLDLVYGDHTTGCVVEPVTDLDSFRFCGDAGDQVRINVISAPNFMDPLVEVRDPSFGVIDTGSCNDSCSLTRDIALPDDGCYTVFVSDVGTNETGDFSLQVERLDPAPAAVPIGYDDVQGDAIEPRTDIDFFTFEAAAGTDVRLNALAASNLMDPTVEIRDPAGTVVVNGVADGASCNDSCSFSVDFSPAVSGTYSLAVYDLTVNETGDYELSLWCLNGACPGIPDPTGPLVSYHTPVADTIESELDADFYRFNATPGSQLRFNVLAGGNFMDPTIEVRNPSGALVINQASCNDSCSFSDNFMPVDAGIHTLIIYDKTTNEVGDYTFGLWCLSGACDSDADGLPDGDVRVSFDTPVVLAYGQAAMDQITPAIDSDIYVFGATAGDFVRFNVNAGGNFMDPTIEVRDPTGAVVINGVADGATCIDSCAFSVDLNPAITGTYELAIYDRGTNESGTYEISLQCLLGSCLDAVAICGDNCVDFPNSAAIPDDGGNVQLDTNGDGFGNACDPDLDNDGIINFVDLNIMKQVFFGNDADADFNGDGSVNFVDLNRMKKLFFGEPGPSCVN